MKHVRCAAEKVLLRCERRRRPSGQTKDYCACSSYLKRMRESLLTIVTTYITIYTTVALYLYNVLRY